MKLKRYTITTDITTGTLNGDILQQQIKDSEHVTEFEYIVQMGDSLDIHGGSINNESSLDTLILNHDGSKQAQLDYEQTIKSDTLKIVENNFINYCEQLTNVKEKASFGTLNTLITTMLSTDPNTAMILSLNLLAIDAEAKREGGLSWWDDCSWHEDI